MLRSYWVCRGAPVAGGEARGAAGCSQAHQYWLISRSALPGVAVVPPRAGVIRRRVAEPALGHLDGRRAALGLAQAGEQVADALGVGRDRDVQAHDRAPGGDLGLLLGRSGALFLAGRWDVLEGHGRTWRGGRACRA